MFPPGGVLTQQPTVGGSAVVSVEYVTASFSSTGGSTDQSQTINLTKGQVQAKCVPFAYSAYATTSDGGTTSWGAVTNFPSFDIVDNAGTPAVKISRQASYMGLEVNVYVVEFGNDIAVQRVVFPTNSGTDLFTDQTITAVDQTKTFAILCNNEFSGDATQNYNQRQLYFTSDTNLRYYMRTNASFPTDDAIAYVIEDTAGTHFDVAYYTFNGHNSNQVLEQAITSVTMADTMIVGHGSNTYLGGGAWYRSSTLSLKNATTLRSYIGHTGNYFYYWSVFVVVWKDGTTVYRGTQDATLVGTASGGTITDNPTLSPAVDVTRSVVATPNRDNQCQRVRYPNAVTGQYTNPFTHFVIDGDGAGVTVTARDAGTAVTRNYNFEVIEFAA